MCVRVLVRVLVEQVSHVSSFLLLLLYATQCRSLFPAVAHRVSEAGTWSRIRRAATYKTPAERHTRTQQRLGGTCTVSVPVHNHVASDQFSKLSVASTFFLTVSPFCSLQSSMHALRAAFRGAEKQWDEDKAMLRKTITARASEVGLRALPPTLSSPVFSPSPLSLLSLYVCLPCPCLSVIVHMRMHMRFCLQVCMYIPVCKNTCM